MTKTIKGELEVDTLRGVIYYHNHTNGISTLRICGLKGLVGLDFTIRTQLDLTVLPDRPAMLSTSRVD
jgi:hypothetical protein